jgi:hypothetical protein
VSGVSPLVQDYDIYADETFLRGSVAFAFGAVICTPRRAELLREALSELRREAAIMSEIKWKKTSKRTLQFYQSVLDVFFDDRWPRFSMMTVTKGRHWQSWARTEEERFFKSYYVFVMRNAGPSSRYNVYVDHRTLQRPYRWKRLHFLVNRARRSEWGLNRRNIRLLEAVDSQDAQLIQLADLLLGCATSLSNAAPKIALREHFRRRSREVGKRVRIDDWSPQAV